MISRDELLRTIACTDHVRGVLPASPKLRPEERSPRKEWYHFCVMAGGMELVLNFSLSADLRPAAPSTAPVARVIVLVRRPDGWSGAVDNLNSDGVRAPVGGLDLSFGPHTMTFVDGAFQIGINIADPPIAVRARIRPETVPLVGIGADLGEGTLSWVVIPRLSASGVVAAGGKKTRFEGAPAYHDHNWGVWPWGADFAWQWGFALPDSTDVPFSVVYSRLSDAAGSRDLDTKLCLWRGDSVARTFQGGDLTRERSGFLRPSRVPRFPPSMSLLAEGTGTDVPRELVWSARTERDHVVCRFQPDDVAQIVLPNETDLDVTLLNEVTGRVEVEGHFGQEPVSFTGRGVFELVQRR